VQAAKGLLAAFAGAGNSAQCREISDYRHYAGNNAVERIRQSTLSFLNIGRVLTTPGDVFGA